VEALQEGLGILSQIAGSRGLVWELLGIVFGTLRLPSHRLRAQLVITSFSFPRICTADITARGGRCIAYLRWNALHGRMLASPFAHSQHGPVQPLCDTGISRESAVVATLLLVMLCT